MGSGYGTDRSEVLAGALDEGLLARGGPLPRKSLLSGADLGKCVGRGFRGRGQVWALGPEAIFVGEVIDDNRLALRGDERVGALYGIRVLSLWLSAGLVEGTVVSFVSELVVSEVVDVPLVS